jgi:hypothetical protein
MRTSVILAIAVAAVVSLAPRNAHAETYYPWCAFYDEWTYNCGFVTMAQCLATISGVGGVCRRNPYPGPRIEGWRARRWAPDRY